MAKKRNKKNKKKLVIVNRDNPNERFQFVADNNGFRLEKVTTSKTVIPLETFNFNQI